MATVTNLPTTPAASTCKACSKPTKGYLGGDGQAYCDAKCEVDALRAENALIKASKPKVAGRITLKRTEKGGLSVYGLGRFPVTLYREQWERLTADSILAEIKAILPTLPLKGEEREQSQAAAPAAAAPAKPAVAKGGRF